MNLNKILNLNQSKQRICQISWLIFVASSAIYLLSLHLFPTGFLFESVLAPYKSVCIAISSAGLILSFSVAILFSVAGEILSPRKMLFVSACLYDYFIMLASISLLLVKVPEPADEILVRYLLQSPVVDESLFPFPRDNYELRRPDRLYISNTDLCEQDMPSPLKYYSFEGDCRFYDSMIISPQAIQDSDAISEFFDVSRDFSLLEDGEVNISNEDRYFVGMVEGTKFFKIETELDLSFFIDYPAYLNVDRNNRLMRLISCRQSHASGAEGGFCQHWVRTQQGTLIYRIKETMELDLELWQEADFTLQNIASRLLVSQ